MDPGNLLQVEYSEVSEIMEARFRFRTFLTQEWPRLQRYLFASARKIPIAQVACVHQKLMFVGRLGPRSRVLRCQALRGSRFRGVIGQAIECRSERSGVGTESIPIRKNWGC